MWSRNCKSREVSNRHSNLSWIRNGFVGGERRCDSSAGKSFVGSRHLTLRSTRSTASRGRPAAGAGPDTGIRNLDHQTVRRRPPPPPMAPGCRARFFLHPAQWTPGPFYLYPEQVAPGGPQKGPVYGPDGPAPRGPRKQGQNLHIVPGSFALSGTQTDPARGRGPRKAPQLPGNRGVYMGCGLPRAGPTTPPV